MTKTEFFTVTARAVVARINRRLRPHGQRLKAKRGRPRLFDPGHYYIVAIKTGRLIERDCDLRKVAIRENAIDLWEEITYEPGRATD